MVVIFHLVLIKLCTKLDVYKQLTLSQQQAVNITHTLYSVLSRKLIYILNIYFLSRSWGVGPGDMKILFESVGQLCDVLMNFFSEVINSVIHIDLPCILEHTYRG